MSWSIGWCNRWERWRGYGVPAICEHPGCNEEIDRGLAYKCGGQWPHDDYGCGMFFCENHLHHAEDDDGDVYQCCAQCQSHQKPFPLKPEHTEWVKHLLTDESWQEWRDKYPDEVKKLKEAGNE